LPKSASTAKHVSSAITSRFPPRPWIKLQASTSIVAPTARTAGVAFILAKSPASPISGKVTLSEPEASDLKAGNFYVAVISRKSPRLSARANLVFPSA
jgi:hypothetical protein